MVEAGGVSYSRDGVAMALYYVLPHSQREDQLNDGHLICGQNHLLADTVEVGHWVGNIIYVWEGEEGKKISHHTCYNSILHTVASRLQIN